MDFETIKYPIYIVSKGRFENPLTAKIFLNEKIDFKIAVEPQEYNNYCETIPEKYILKLPFSNLGLGSYPSRNFCRDHSMKNNYKKHWLFDDNIRCFSRLNNGIRKKTIASFAISSLEKFTDRYCNIALSGFNYRYFVTRDTKKPFTINTHVYSGMLIDNKFNYKFRLKYNEDVDLCLQILHNKLCTVLFNAFLIDKTSTVVKMKGGNQTELYNNNDFNKKILKAKSLETVWTQYVKTVIRFNRPHHYINWKKHFKQSLIKI